MSLATKLVTVAENVPKVYESGKTAEYERFWDSFLAMGNRRSFNYGFSGNGWKDDILVPPLKYLPLVATSAEYMFRYCPATLLPSVDFTNCETLENTYAYATVAVTIGTVILRADGTNKFDATFNRCDELKNITFDGVIGSSINFGRSSKLTSESIDNIIEHLKDLTGATAQTITFHTTTVNKMTAEQATMLINKNWNVG